MKTRNLLFLSLIASAAMFLLAYLSNAQLDPGSQLAIRWNANGEPTRYASSFWALTLPALTLLGLSLIFAIIPSIEPLQDRLEGSAPLFRATWLGFIPLILLIQLKIAAPIWGLSLGVNVILFACGAILIAIGNAMPKSRPGFFVGIRTPWTITNEDNWIATHRLGGKLAILAGAVTIVASLMLDTVRSAAIVMCTATLAATAIPSFYSWWHWKQNQAKGESA